MAKIRYYYDTETCKYERIKVSITDYLINVAGFLIISMLLAFVLFYVHSVYFESPVEARLRKENEELIFYYNLLETKVRESNEMLSALQDRDDNIYRVIFEAEPISKGIREGGIGGAQRYSELISKGISQEELVLNALMRVDQLRKKLYIQTKSYDELISMAKNKEKLWSSIPAIQPVSNDQLTRLASGFGMRIHPIYKVKKFHSGIDFTALKGTPIYVTGDGVVQSVENNPFTGYGRCVVVDHGFGYQTLYAHMEKPNVRPGQKVKRGEVIGFVGSTGLSTSPHLHYEVIKNGTKVNPVYHFYDDLSADEFEKILELASVENQSLGGN